MQHTWLERASPTKLLKYEGIMYQVKKLREDGKQAVIKNVKVSKYPFKQNKSMFKNMTVLLYTYSYNISLNILIPTFFNIYNSFFFTLSKYR